MLSPEVSVRLFGRGTDPISEKIEKWKSERLHSGIPIISPRACFDVGASAVVKQIIKTGRTPSPLGPYSQGTEASRFVFTSGQGPVNPKTGKIVDGGIQEQTAQVLDNIKSILEESGATIDDVVKVNVFIKNAEDFKAMNEVYSRYFSKDPPARTTVVAKLVSNDLLVEIDAVAYMGT